MALSLADHHAAFCRFVDVLAGSEGDAVAMMECYFDESGSDDGAPIMCVAGYLFEKEHCKALGEEWRITLNRFSIPYFRMSSCAHLNEPFDMMSREDSIECEKIMIATIRKYMTFGSVMSVDSKAFTKKYVTLHNETSMTPYSLCCYNSLIAMMSWANLNNFHGEIAYFFESGHNSESEADGIMKRIFKNPVLRKQYRYAGHAFIPKERHGALQSADILAWHHIKECKRIADKQPSRRDFAALVDGAPIQALHYSADILNNMSSILTSFDNLRTGLTTT